MGLSQQDPAQTKHRTWTLHSLFVHVIVKWGTAALLTISSSLFNSCSMFLFWFFQRSNVGIRFFWGPRRVTGLVNRGTSFYIIQNVLRSCENELAEEIVLVPLFTIDFCLCSFFVFCFNLFMTEAGII